MNTESEINHQVREVVVSGESKLSFVTVKGNDALNGTIHMEGIHALLLNAEVYAGTDIYPVKSNGRLPVHFLGTSHAVDFIDGVQWCEVSGVNVTPIHVNDRVVGKCYEDEYARYAVLGNLVPFSVAQSRLIQTSEVFELMETALTQVGMDFSQVVRTWFYNDRILEWYGEFNQARDAFFRSREVFDRLVPASTGVGSCNRHGSVLMARAFAIQPKSDRVRVQAVASPLQCPALDYRSSFSRAVEISHPAYHQLMISGTASIHPGGATAHVGDIEKQIDLSMEVVAKILQSRAMSWQDSVRAVIYLKEKSYAHAFLGYCKEHSLQQLPYVMVQSDICRDDLLFEIELDAVRSW